MAATAPAFIMVFMYTEPDIGWHHAVKRCVEIKFRTPHAIDA